MAITHPAREQLDLSNVLSALGDSTRLAMVTRLAPHDEVSCGEFASLGSKTVISYHMAKLRRDDLDTRFPGLLGTILQTQAPHEAAAVPVHDSYDWVID